MAKKQEQRIEFEKAVPDHKGRETHQDERDRQREMAPNYGPKTEAESGSGDRTPDKK